ncbi:MAG: helix-turn-helix transcriptional regulator [Clostridiales bacterium]|nr:helix-turn-helix transcriptional regulator [Clostridiales bacterium]
MTKDDNNLNNPKIQHTLAGRSEEDVKDYIASIKSRQLLGVESYKPYPYDKEKLLISAITTGNAETARRYLNEILGFIFFTGSENLMTLKARAVELTVLISRASLDAGADESEIYSLCPKFINHFISLDNLEDICRALTSILNRFMELTFNRPDVRNISIISRATAFIAANYMHPITLKDTADHIYISSSYLSRIFRSEMGVRFSEYLTKYRIDKSRLLLTDPELTVSDVASLVGYTDQSYFNKVFKRITGVSPKKWRLSNGNPPAENKE